MSEQHPPTICRCGLAKSYHPIPEHTYEPRYEPRAWREGYCKGEAEGRQQAVRERPEAVALHRAVRTLTHHYFCREGGSCKTCAAIEDPGEDGTLTVLMWRAESAADDFLATVPGVEWGTLGAGLNASESPPPPETSIDAHWHETVERYASESSPAEAAHAKDWPDSCPRCRRAFGDASESGQPPDANDE